MWKTKLDFLWRKDQTQKFPPFSKSASNLVRFDTKFLGGMQKLAAGLIAGKFVKFAFILMIFFIQWDLFNSSKIFDKSEVAVVILNSLNPSCTW